MASHFEIRGQSMTTIARRAHQRSISGVAKAFAPPRRPLTEVPMQTEANGSRKPIAAPTHHQARVRVDFAEVNRAVLAAFPVVLGRLLPGGKYAGHEYVAFNPRRADRHLGSFRVNIRTGKWADFATGDKGGDPISLFAYTEDKSQVDAARLLARMLGVRS
jgi:hypothetical protein